MANPGINPSELSDIFAQLTRRAFEVRYGTNSLLLLDTCVEKQRIIDNLSQELADCLATRKGLATHEKDIVARLHTLKQQLAIDRDAGKGNCAASQRSESPIGTRSTSSKPTHLSHSPSPEPAPNPMNIPASSMVTETPGALIASHSHIRGLGVDLDTLTPRFSSQGLVGQERARKAAALIIKMVEERKIAGRAILIAGPPSTGKTAIAMGMAQTLGSEVPFVTMSGSEIYSKEISKTEALTQAFRKGVAVRVSEETEFIEGEVVEIQLDKSVTQANRQGRIIMKTNDMESAFNLGPKLIDSLEKEHVIAGDIISVNMSSNRIVKLGRSYARSRDYDAMGKDTKFVTCPDGELRKRKEETHIVSLHEIDVINSRPQGYMGLFSGDTGEIPSETRDQINVKVDEWKEEGKADLLPGVLFIDEVHMLDVESFSFMNKWTENELSPIVIMASNRGNATVRGTVTKAPHGMPLDFLDRCVIISTHPYNAHELQEILKIRAQEEEVELTEGAVALLTKVAEERGLRYGSQLIATSHEVAKKRRGGEAKVEEGDVERAYGLFLDPKRSVELVTEHQGESMELS